MFAVKFKKSILGGTVEFVAGFNARIGVVQRSNDLEYVRKWKTARAAEKFVQKYSGAGYGLTSEMVEVVSL